MQVAHISDTHTLHREIEWTEEQFGADMLIHSGDISDVGREEELRDFFDWVKSLPFKYKIIIAGNHDKSLDEKFWFNKAVKKDKFKKSLIGCELWSKEILDEFNSHANHHYLHDSSVEIEGIKIYGSPYSVNYHPEYWAFNKPDNEESYQLYSKIPADTDILVTHGPPYGKLDVTVGGLYVGSHILKGYIEEIKPKFHLFGHVHESYGAIQSEHTVFLNSCMVNKNNILANEPQIFEI